MTTPRIPIRHFHLLGYCAVGAIIDTPDCKIVPMDTRYWVDKKGSPLGKEILFVDLTRQHLGIFPKKLIRPPLAKRQGILSDFDNVLPAIRFPKWMRCWRCGALYYSPKWENNQKPRCDRCERPSELEQVPWVLIHKEGYMDDIPWQWLAHYNASPENKTCRDYKSLSLKQNEALQWVLKCNCNTSVFLFSEKFLKKPDRIFSSIKMDQQPWISQHAELNNVSPIAIEIGNVRIYQPNTRLALVIPPESRIQTDSLTAKLYSLRGELDKLRLYHKNKSLFDSHIRILADMFGVVPDEIRNSWDEIRIPNGFPYFGNTPVTSGNLNELEYQALITSITDLRENEAFVTRHLSDGWRQLQRQTRSTGITPIIQSIERLVAVDRLKAIWVYEGFTRNLGNKIPPDLEGKQDWLPALELFGEGVFITLFESAIAEWEAQECVKNRFNATQSRLRYSRNSKLPGKVTPRFVLLHTLAHLMIRQMEFSCGYPAASLKERLYVQSPSEELIPMAGILIYVAVPDKVGSLGGLVDIANPEHFLDLLIKVFNQAAWCSFDPVCSEHDGHGPDMLNRAACHACALIPETACEYDNALLDRVLISGELKKENGIPPFLDFIQRWATDERNLQSS